MALKQVILAHHIRARLAEKEKLTEALSALNERRKALDEKEQLLTRAVEELPEVPATEEDEGNKKAVLEEVEGYEKEVEALKAEMETVNGEIAKIDEKIDALESELSALEAPEPEPEPEPVPEERSKTPADRKERMITAMKTRALALMPVNERAQLARRDDVKNFLTRCVDIIKRSVTNAQVTVPEVLLPLVKEEIMQGSKLLKHVYHVNVPGEASLPVMGDIPEAVWTQACADVNELNLSMYLVELSAYKIAGYYGVCRYIAEDASVNLLDELIFALGRGIGIGIDKAILFGTGSYMPMGISTRILQTENPGNAGQYARPWVNLATSNVTAITAANSTGTKLVSGIIGALANVKKGKGEGLFWAMNSTTKMKILSELLNFNANGVLVSGVANQMPAVGGAIEELEFMPDGLIVAGYGKNYIAAERGHIRFETSDQVRWIEEQTLVKGAGRFDGKPIQPAAFALIGINGVAPATAAATVTFASGT